MTEEKDIMDVVQGQMSAFLLQPYPHNLPDWFMDYFATAIMELPPGWVGYNGESLRSTTYKKYFELNILEVGFVANVYLYSKPSILAKNVTNYIPKRILIEKIRSEYTTLTEGQREKLFKEAQARKKVSQKTPRIYTV